MLYPSSYPQAAVAEVVSHYRRSWVCVQQEPFGRWHSSTPLALLSVAGLESQPGDSESEKLVFANFLTPCFVGDGHTGGWSILCSRVLLREMHAQTSSSCFLWFYRMFPHHAVTCWGSLLILCSYHWHWFCQGTCCLCFWQYVLATAIWCLVKSWCWVSRCNYHAELIAHAWLRYLFSGCLNHDQDLFIYHLSSCQTALECAFGCLKKKQNKKKSHSLPSSLWVISVSLLWVSCPQYSLQYFQDKGERVAENQELEARLEPSCQWELEKSHWEGWSTPGFLVCLLHLDPMYLLL